MLRIFSYFLKNKPTGRGLVATKAALNSKRKSTPPGASVSSKTRLSPSRRGSVAKSPTKSRSPRARESPKSKSGKSSTDKTSARKGRPTRNSISSASRSVKPKEGLKQKPKTDPEKVAKDENENDAMDSDATRDSLRPAYMSRALEKKVMNMAERMQTRDLSGEVPVASFAYDILKTHPSVRNMGLRERMDFLCKRWEALSEEERLEYLNHPLKGLL